MPVPSPSLLADLGGALRSLRIERRISQEELGLLTGIHRNYIGGIERAERQPTVLTVARLAAALEVPTWQLLRLAEDGTPPGAG